MAKRRPVLAEKSAPARARARRKIGKLSEQVISATAAARYTTALRTFFLWVRRKGLPSAQSTLQLDSLVCAFIDEAWEEGEGRSLIGNLICGLQHRVPALRGHLHGSWRLWAAWGRHELPARAAPLSLKAVEAMAALAMA